MAGLALAASPTGAQQPPKLARIGVLFDDAISSAPLRQGLRELGYVEGHNIIVEERLAAERHERWPELVAELLRLNVDLIVTRNTPATLAAKRATSTIPIVMAGAGDPLSTGAVSSLAQPGGNVTGVAFLGAGLAAKRMELLRDTLPRLASVVLHWNPANPAQVSYFHEAQAAARALGISLHAVEVRNGKDLETALASTTRAAPSALLITGDPVIQRYSARIIAFAAKQRLPAMYNSTENVRAGGLMSYGPSRAAIARRAAFYVDRILKGAHPGSLPVEQPTTFELVINLKTAKALGLAIPASVLLRADELIQ